MYIYPLPLESPSHPLPSHHSSQRSSQSTRLSPLPHSSFPLAVYFTHCPTLQPHEQAPLSLGFPRQEYWSGLPFPTPVDRLYPGIEPGSSALLVDSLPLSHKGNPRVYVSVLFSHCTPPSLPAFIPGSVLYVCISIPAL